MSKQSALLVIDVQNGMFDPRWPIYEESTLLSNIRTLITQARLCDVPVIYIQHTESEGPLIKNTESWQIHPSIAPVLDEITIAKTTPDAFYDTELNDVLETKGISQLVIVGLQSDYCIDATARRAYSLGYDTILVADAHSTMDSESQNAEDIIALINQSLGSNIATLIPTHALDFSLINRS